MFIIGEILEVVDHPNADRLIVTQVNIGDDKTLQVVTNDKTISVGDKIVVATEGQEVKFPDGTSITIKATKMRGVDSFGMFCGVEVTNIEGDGVSRLSNTEVVGKEFNI